MSHPISIPASATASWQSAVRGVASTTASETIASANPIVHDFPIMICP